MTARSFTTCEIFFFGGTSPHSDGSHGRNIGTPTDDCAVKSNALPVCR